MVCLALCRSVLGQSLITSKNALQNSKSIHPKRDLDIFHSILNMIVNKTIVKIDYFMQY